MDKKYVHMQYSGQILDDWRFYFTWRKENGALLYNIDDSIKLPRQIH